MLGAHLADLLFTDRRWRDGLLFSFVKRAAESDAAVAYPVRLRMPPCSHRPVTAVRCVAGHRDRRDRCASDRRTARGSLHRTWRKPDAESRPADVTAELRSRPKRFLPGLASSEKLDDPTRPPIERVIQITQARLENQFTEDGSTRKMTPYRSQTPLRWRFKARLAESARLPV